MFVATVCCSHTAVHCTHRNKLVVCCLRDGFECHNQLQLASRQPVKFLRLTHPEWADADVH